MSEEKKELEHIKKRAEFVTKNIMGTNIFTTYDVHCVNTLIEIIEKQQKQIEQEKEKNKLLIQGKFREVADKNSYIKDMYIAKYKIKEKIKELNNSQCATHEERNEHLYAMEVLKELCSGDDD